LFLQIWGEELHQSILTLHHLDEKWNYLCTLWFHGQNVSNLNGGHYLIPFATILPVLCPE
jgi:hypothetical protein